MNQSIDLKSLSIVQEVATRHGGARCAWSLCIKASWTRALLGIALSCWIGAASAQESLQSFFALSEDHFKSGAVTMRAFRSVGEKARDSVVRVDLDGKTVALGAVIEANGLIITKASELKDGKLTCKLKDGREVEAKVMAIDEDNDVALLRASAKNLKPVKWVEEDAGVGQWVVTAGTTATPEAVGIISVPTRKILPKRAMIGVTLSSNPAAAEIREVTPGYGADKAGLKSGDIVLTVNGTQVKTRDELTERLQEFREGEVVKIRVQRGDEIFDAAVHMTDASLVLRTATLSPQAAALESVNRALGSELAKLAQARTALNDATFAPQLDIPVIEARTADLAKAEEDLALARAREFAKVRGKFTNDEIEALKQQAARGGRGGRGFGGGGRGFDRQAIMNRMGSELSRRAEDFDLAIQHDTVLQPWQCGGPLLNLDGEAVGINIARAGRVASYALPAELVKRVVESLKAEAAAAENIQP